MNIECTTFTDLSNETREALVFLGAGGDLSEWYTGTGDALRKTKIFKSQEIDYDGVAYIKTTGGRIDLVCYLPQARVDIGKLAMWKISWGEVSWLSDYVDNYAEQHGYDLEEERFAS